MIALPGRRVVFKYTGDEKCKEEEDMSKELLNNVTVEDEPLHFGPTMKYNPDVPGVAEVQEVDISRGAARHFTDILRNLIRYW